MTKTEPILWHHLWSSSSWTHNVSRCSFTTSNWPVPLLFKLSPTLLLCSGLHNALSNIMMKLMIWYFVSDGLEVEWLISEWLMKVWTMSKICVIFNIWHWMQLVECIPNVLSWYLFIFFSEVDAYCSYILGRVWRSLNTCQGYLFEIPDSIACASTNNTQMGLKCPNNTLNSHQTWPAAHWNFVEPTQGHCMHTSHTQTSFT